MAYRSIGYIVESRAIDVLCELLNTPDVQTLAVILYALNSYLKKAAEMNAEMNVVAARIEEIDKVGAIEQLQQHENQVIYKLAVDILENYFDVEDLDTLLDNEPTSNPSAPISIFKF